MQRLRAVDFVRRPVAQAFARPAVELIVYPLNRLLADASQGFALRKALPKEAVGVLVGAALPQMMRQREVEFHADVGRDLDVVRELLAPAGRSGISRETLILPLRSDGPRRRFPRCLSRLLALRPPMHPSKSPSFMPR